MESTQAAEGDMNKVWGRFPFTPSRMRPHHSKNTVTCRESEYYTSWTEFYHVVAGTKGAPSSMKFPAHVVVSWLE